MRYTVDMRSRTFFFIFAITTVVLVLPTIAYAESVSIPFFGPIIPKDVNKCAAGWGAVILVINRIIAFLITLAIVFVAPLMIAYAGFLFVVNPVNPSGKEKAKGILKNTIVGIIIALGAWMIVDAIMVVLYNPEAKEGKTELEAWTDIITSGGEDFCLIREGAMKKLNQGLISGSSATGDLTVVPPSTEPPSENTIRQQFVDAFVDINNKACNPYNIDGVKYSCTNVGRMLDATVNQVIEIKGKCNCPVTINGGSEAGHASGKSPGNHSHGNGYKVDLDMNSALNSFIQKFSMEGKRNEDTIYLDKCKNQYVQESDHWDITVFRFCNL